jgi:hypothetical protein
MRIYFGISNDSCEGIRCYMITIIIREISGAVSQNSMILIIGTMLSTLEYINIYSNLTIEGLPPVSDVKDFFPSDVIHYVHDSREPIQFYRKFV